MDDQPNERVNTDLSEPHDEPVIGRITVNGGPPTAVSLIAGMSPRHHFNAPGKIVWLGLAIFLTLAAALVVPKEQPRGMLAIRSVSLDRCEVAYSGCASHPVPWATVEIVGSHSSVTVTTGADGHAVVGLVPGEYSVAGSSAGDLRGIDYAGAVIQVGETTEVTLTFTW